VSNAKLVKFEEVTPTLLRVAYFDGHLAALISHLNLPIYGAYDSLDEMVFTFLTLSSGKTVTLGEYANSPRTGVDLYVDSKMEGISAAVYESCQQLGISRDKVVWFRDKFQSEIEQLFAEQGDIKEIAKEVGSESQQVIYDPISCFQHALKIYDQAAFPEYWAILQHNLGSTYYKVFQDEKDSRGENLKLAIDCLYYSLEVCARQRLPERWEISRETLGLFKCLRYEDLHDTDLTEVNLRGADLTGANLSGANLRRANLVEANFSDIIVMKTIFGSTLGISIELQIELEEKGAIFEDRFLADSQITFSARSYNSNTSIIT
jgi:Pentapeptide repeats (8 copies)